MNAKLASEVRYLFNLTKNGVTKYIKFFRKITLLGYKILTNPSLLYINFFNMLDIKTVMRTIWPVLGQIIKKILNITIQQFKVMNSIYFMFITGYNSWYLRRMIPHLRNIILLTDRMKNCLYPNLQHHNTWVLYICI